MTSTRTAAQEPPPQSAGQAGTESTIGQAPDSSEDLFPDGSFARWKLIGGGRIENHWRSEPDGWIHLHRPVGYAGSLISNDQYGDMELSFEWRAAPKTNGGIKYRVKSYDRRQLGLEYQIYNVDSRKSDSSRRHSNAAIYDLFSTIEAACHIDEHGTHTGRIVVQNQRIEHYIDGVLAASAVAGSPEWEAAVQRSKHAERPGFGTNPNGRLLFTDHGGEIWYRNVILIRK